MHGAKCKQGVICSVLNQSERIFACLLLDGRTTPVQLNQEVAGLISIAAITCHFHARRRAEIRWLYCPATASVRTGIAPLPLAASLGLQGAAG